MQRREKLGPVIQSVPATLKGVLSLHHLNWEAVKVLQATCAHKPCRCGSIVKDGSLVHRENQARGILLVNSGQFGG